MIMTSKQAAEYLGMKAGTLAKWRHESKGPDYVKYGGLIRYYKQDIDLWLKKNIVDPEL